MDQHKKDQGISAGATALIMVLSILLCSWLGYHLPDPPIEEEGMGVAGEVLGEIEGFGNNDMADFPSESTPAPSTPAPDEGYTTGSEPAPVAKATQKDPKPTPQPKEAPSKPTENPAPATTPTQTTTPATNSNALFKGNKKGDGTEGKGAATGSGQAGSLDGSKGATNGTGQGTGSGYNLGGRTLRGTLPKPAYNSNLEGNVVVRIKVDRQGKVVEVEAPMKGSKNYDNKMVESAKKAAMQAHFSADPNATEYQYGTITYQFRRQG